MIHDLLVETALAFFGEKRPCYLLEGELLFTLKMAVYVAYRERGKGPKRLARQNALELRQELRTFANTTWTVARYTTSSWKEETLCRLFENPLKVEADDVERYDVSSSGRIRRVYE